MLIHDNCTSTQETIMSLVNIYEESNKSIGAEPDDLSKLYIRIIKTIISDQIDTSNDNERNLLLLKFKGDKSLDDNPEIYDLLQTLLTTRDTTSVDVYKTRVDNVRRAVLFHHISKANKNIFRHLNNAQSLTSSVMQQDELNKIIQNANDIINANNDASKTTVLSKASGIVDIDNVDSITAAVTRAKSKVLPESVLKSGLQALNRALGKYLGIPQGKSLVINALSHHYKSGMLMSWAVWALMYNSPLNTSQKELVLFISLENEEDENLIWIFRKAYYATYGEMPPAEMPDDILVSHITEIFRKSGFAFQILRYHPATFGYDDLVAVFNHFKTLGFKIRVCIIDYINKMKKGSSIAASEAANHLMVQDLYSNICNIGKNMNVTIISAHQLNRHAKELAAMNVNVVKKFGDQHLTESSGVQREIDIAIYQHLEFNPEGIRFLTNKLDKHRGEDDTPESHKYFAYPFHPNVGIIDDINGPPGYTTNILTYSFKEMYNNDPVTNVRLAYENKERVEAAEAAEIQHAF